MRNLSNEKTGFNAINCRNHSAPSAFNKTFFMIVGVACLIYNVVFASPALAGMAVLRGKFSNSFPFLQGQNCEPYEICPTEFAGQSFEYATNINAVANPYQEVGCEFYREPWYPHCDPFITIGSRIFVTNLTGMTFNEKRMSIYVGDEGGILPMMQFLFSLPPNIYRERSALSGSGRIAGLVNGRHLLGTSLSGFGSGCNNDCVIENASITITNGIPEPEVWVELLVGLFGLGFMMRRQRGGEAISIFSQGTC